MSTLHTLPVKDSNEMAAARLQELDIARNVARMLGMSAVDAMQNGFYETSGGDRVDWSEAVQSAIMAKVSIPPDAELPDSERHAFNETRIQITNETTLATARELINSGHRPLALNFANGVIAGGGFQNGARAQEENLCRSSALYATLDGDPMYEFHFKQHSGASSDWTILSPNVPVFRTDDGTELDEPWLLNFLTCAAPYAPTVGQPLSGDLLHQRIHRILVVSKAYGYSTLVLGAWGCGAFGNDPHRTAVDFRNALENEFSGAFSDIVFAITDWSPERRILGPFRDVFVRDTV